MMYLGLPQIDHDNLIDELVDDRQNGVNAEYFESIRAEWKARARFYIEQRGNPESIAPWGLVGEYGGTLKNLYSSRNVDDVQVPVIKTLRGRTLQMCPFCGENGAPQTLDHYLPKDSFPEFAAIPANLAPMCDACQEGKATKTVDPDLQRYFLHPYFDEMAAHQMITLSIHEPYSAPEGFELRPLPILGEEWISLVQRHLKELGVEGRFSKYFDDQYVRLLRQVQDVRAENEDVRTMIKQFAGMNRRRSRNCWDHVFYAGVLANPALMVFLESGDLPLNL